MVLGHWLHPCCSSYPTNSASQNTCQGYTLFKHMWIHKKIEKLLESTAEWECMNFPAAQLVRGKVSSHIQISEGEISLIAKLNTIMYLLRTIPWCSEDMGLHVSPLWEFGECDHSLINPNWVEINLERLQSICLPMSSSEVQSMKNMKVLECHFPEIFDR